MSQNMDNMGQEGQKYKLAGMCIKQYLHTKTWVINRQ